MSFLATCSFLTGTKNDKGTTMTTLPFFIRVGASGAKVGTSSGLSLFGGADKAGFGQTQADKANASRAYGSYVNNYFFRH